MRPILTNNDGWSIYNSIDGKAYEITSQRREAEGNSILGSDDIVDFIPTNNNKNPYFYEFFKRYKWNQEYILSVQDEYKEPLIELIEDFIKSSKCKIIVFYCRMQEPAKERYIGVIPFKKFVKLLDNGKILHNVAYFVGGK